VTARRGLTACGGAVLLAAAVCLAGCGVPIDNTARPIKGQDLPTPLSGQGSTSGTGTARAKVERPIFLLDNARLVRAGRRLDTPGDVPAVIGALLAGPTKQEVTRGRRSAIPPDTRLLSSTVADGIATLDLSSELAAVGGDAQRYSLAQLVWTATAVPGVRAVRIAVEGQTVSVPNPEGQVLDRPLTRHDFPAQLEPPATAPTPAHS
jgi:hypothetical protein